MVFNNRFVCWLVGWLVVFFFFLNDVTILRNLLSELTCKLLIWLPLFMKLCLKGELNILVVPCDDASKNETFERKDVV